MKAMIVQTSEPVALIGGGAVAPADLAEVLTRAPVLVAADGGADRALAAGRMPDAVVGDMDSISEAARAAIPAARLHCVPEQESTDFDKCLRMIEAPLIFGLGFLGPRLDHQLAVLTGLTRQTEKRCILIGEHDIAFLCPPRLAITLDPGARVSLFPMGPVTGQSRGLKWPIDGIGFAPDGRIGTSNEATGGTVELEVAAPRMVVILPRAALAAAAAALSG